MDIMLDERDKFEADNLEQLRKGTPIEPDTSKDEIDELTGTANTGVARDGFVWPEWKEDVLPHIAEDLLPEEKEREKPVIPRLMALSELPAWLILEEQEVAAKIEKLNKERIEATSCRRARNAVNYADRLSENEWLLAVDAGLDPEEVARQKFENGELEAIPEENSGNQVNSESEDESGSRGNGKRKGRGKKKGKRLKEMDDDDDEVPEPKKKKRGRQVETKEIDADTKDLLMRLHDYVMKWMEPNTDRILSKPFHKLPTKKELPDYYELIREPIDLRKIKERIKKDRYGSLKDMTRDFDLLIANTQTYNIDGSLIYDDSVVLQTVYQDALEKIDKYGKLPNELEPEDLEENRGENVNESKNESDGGENDEDGGEHKVDEHGQNGENGQNSENEENTQNDDDAPNEDLNQSAKSEQMNQSMDQTNDNMDTEEPKIEDSKQSGED